MDALTIWPKRTKGIKPTNRQGMDFRVPGDSELSILKAPTRPQQLGLGEQSSCPVFFRRSVRKGDDLAKLGTRTSYGCQPRVLDGDARRNLIDPIRKVECFVNRARISPKIDVGGSARLFLLLSLPSDEKDCGKIGVF